MEGIQKNVARARRGRKPAYLWAATVLVVVLVLVTPHAAADLVLKDRPDESADYTYHERFSTENALRRIGQLREAVHAFQTITELYKPVGAKEIEGIPCTDGVTQLLGLPNWLGAVEGTLRKQDYVITKLEWELAQARERLGEATAEEVTEKHQAFEKAERDFQKFWDGFDILD
jgi:hypothetical protein